MIPNSTNPASRNSGPANPNLVRIRLEPLAVEIEVPPGASLASALAAHGVEFPCGGMGECGGCGVRVLSGSLPVTTADHTAFTADQIASGWRLACQARANAPLALECGQWRMDILADNAGPRPATLATQSTRHGLGIAVDLGTTTIAAQIVDLAAGTVLGVETALNPQAAFGSDVMSRVRAALDGADLTTPIRATLGAIVARLAHGRQSEITEVLLVGNTVMHHLFSGLDVEPLAHVPFQSPNLGEQRFTARELAWDLPSDCSIRFARCLGGFVGSDILAGIVATGIASSDRHSALTSSSALIDLGTNGEIAIGNRRGIVCASTAAGPAFEAGAIRMGMRAVTGAVSYVALNGGSLRAIVIGDTSPRGICGSGLVDAVSAGLASTAILASGRIADGTKIFPIAPPVVLHQSDIRELQLAKAAIAAGFRLLLNRLGAAQSDLQALHLAGAFGNYVQIESALRIGLIESPRAIIHAAGNTALRGAKLMLRAGGEPPLPHIEHVSLAADPAFQDEFAACMAFPALQNL
jgi:uncharacterized 2Fe-2S/4Fe-4S cluster protein (DUF4445 family)